MFSNSLFLLVLVFVAVGSISKTMASPESKKDRVRRRTKGFSNCRGKGKGKGKRSIGDIPDCLELRTPAPVPAPTPAPVPAPTPAPIPAPTVEPTVDRDGDGSSIVIPISTTLNCEVETPLVDGSTLSASVEVTGPIDGSPPLDGSGSASISLDITGQASLEAGVRNAFAHFAYVIDVSDSTLRPCGGTSTGTILDCEKEAILNLNEIIAGLDVAVDIGAIAFNGAAISLDLDTSTPGIQTLVPPTEPGIVTAINNLESVGSTSFFRAIRKLIEDIEAATLNPAVTETIVIFVTDGISPAGATPADLQTLADKGTKIYTFAIGEESECGLQLQRMSSDLGTGGFCTRVTDPSQLEVVLQDVILPPRFLDSVSVTVNSQPSAVALNPPIGSGLPADTGPTTITGSATVTDGSSSSICVEATSISELARCCVDFVA